MIKVRELEKSEYPKLAHVSEGYIPPVDASITLIAEDGGQIVGRMFLVTVAHIEGTWLSSSVRKGIVGVRLIEEMQAKAKDIGLTKLLAYAPDTKVADYLRRLGFRRLDLSVWEKELTQCP